MLKKIKIKFYKTIKKIKLIWKNEFIQNFILYNLLLLILIIKKKKTHFFTTVKSVNIKLLKNEQMSEVRLN